jgi:hypothetical protein
MNPEAKRPSNGGVATAPRPAVPPANGRARQAAGPGRAGPPPIPSPQPLSASPSLLDLALNPVIRFFTSIRLTVVCLALALVLVFFGTMAQDPIGLYLAQEKFFRSFFVSAAPMWAAIKKTLQMLHIYLPPSTAADVLFGSKLPVFPGGYLIGGVLLINLVASHFKRFAFAPSKAGIWMVHAGLILLLLGQLGTDLLSRESSLHLREGQAKNYSETDREAEMVVIDATSPEFDKVVAIPQGVLMRRNSIQHSELPFTLRIKNFFPNSVVSNRSTNAVEAAAASQGLGPHVAVKDLPRVTEMDKRDVPSAVVEVVTPQGSLGTWVVSEYIDQPQSFTFNNRTYQLALRPRRHYKPYSLQLLKFQHDIYAGTDIPKNFSSRVVLERPDTGEKREVLIYMNSPLRYAGETYYQASYDEDNHGTILQVVHNPSWLTPYFSCILVGAGLVVQFATHLVGFTRKRRTA